MEGLERFLPVSSKASVHFLKRLSFFRGVYNEFLSGFAFYFLQFQSKLGISLSISKDSFLAPISDK